jgi:putative exosortase-associated protein (TIGR04073 family)
VQAAIAESGDLTIGNNPVRKLGRGLANIVSSPLEIPLGIVSVYEVDGAFAGSTVGTLYGLTAMLLRLAAGGVEVVTFPAPLPGVGYGPLVEPEFLSEPGHPEGLSLTLTQTKW